MLSVNMEIFQRRIMIIYYLSSKLAICRTIKNIEQKLNNENVIRFQNNIFVPTIQQIKGDQKLFKQK